MSDTAMQAESQDGGTTSDIGVGIGRLSSLVPDGHNANAGTERGRAMVEESLRRFGAGRSILADRHGRIIAGNTTHEAATDIGLTDAIIVKTDGTRLVVVQRTDLDIDSPEARALAVADNRTSEVGLRWDTAELTALATDKNINLAMMFSAIELADILGADAPVPRFDPAGADHRLDELAGTTTCPACGHSWQHGLR